MGKIFLVCWYGKGKYFSGLRSFHMPFRIILFKIDNFAFVVLTIVLPVVELGMSFGKD